MDEKSVVADNVNMVEIEKLDVKLEEDEDDFRSCCQDEDELKEKEESEEDVDVYSVKLYFKGVSVTCPGDSGSRVSGIGVVMEIPNCKTPIRVQKKLDFYVDEMVAEYLALLDGLSLAIQQDMRRVFAFTNSQALHNQIVGDEGVGSPILVALRQRILEQASNIETFVLKLVPVKDVQKALSLAQVAVGIVSLLPEGEESTESCSICCKERLSSMMLKLRCSHKFCSHCMKTYVEGKTQLSQVPIRCPQLECMYCVSATECSLFLPVSSYESLERALTEANAANSRRIYCPYPGCSVLLDPHDCSSTRARARASSLSQSDNSCMECPVCRKFICVDCVVPWHSSMTCVEYQNLPLETDRGRCALWDDEYREEIGAYPGQELEQWAWESFESLPTLMDVYSDQERSQLALIQRFIAGGLSLNEQNRSESPPPPPPPPPPRCADSYAEAMKDLHQLPWLERFVSVISDSYYEDYIQ